MDLSSQVPSLEAPVPEVPCQQEVKTNYQRQSYFPSKLRSKSTHCDQIRIAIQRRFAGDHSEWVSTGWRKRLELCAYLKLKPQIKLNWNGKNSFSKLFMYQCSKVRTVFPTKFYLRWQCSNVRFHWRFSKICSLNFSLKFFLIFLKSWSHSFLSIQCLLQLFSQNFDLLLSFFVGLFFLICKKMVYVPSRHLHVQS